MIAADFGKENRMSRQAYLRLRNALVWIVAAFGLLLLALNAIWYWINRPHPGIHVPQQAQFHSIEAALELFNNEFHRNSFFLKGLRVEASGLGLEISVSRV